MDDIKEGLVEDFGLGYAKFGHSELLGRVVGLLMYETEALTDYEIAEELHVTKSPINQITRRLEELNLVRRIRKKGDRKYYYRLSPNVFLNAGTNLFRLYEENLQVADRHLRVALDKFEAADGEEKEHYRTICERLIHMREFHMRLLEMYRRFIDEWKEEEAELPSVEAYRQEMDELPSLIG